MERPFRRSGRTYASDCLRAYNGLCAVAGPDGTALKSRSRCWSACDYQAQTAGLSGLVFDPSKLAVPTARLVVENAETSATRSVLSNLGGVYNVSALPPGHYSITVQPNGFKTIHQSDVILEVAQHARALPNPTNSAGRSATP